MDALRGGEVVKRVASTSRLAFKELLDVLQPRERDVLVALRAHVIQRREWPTAYELLERMRADHPGVDVNSIRPRRTSLRHKSLVVGDRKWLPGCHVARGRQRHRADRRSTNGATMSPKVPEAAQMKRGPVEEPTPLSPRLLSAQGAAKYLGVPYTSLRDWALRGHVPIVRVPDCRRAVAATR